LAPVPHEKGKGHYGGSYLEELDWWTKPREKSRMAELKYMVLEIVFLKAVWEHNRSLWRYSFPFHLGLYLLVAAGALLGLAAAAAAVGVAAVWPLALRVAITAIAAAGYSLGAAGAVGLLVKRLSDPRLEDFTSPATLFNLVLLFAVFASGLGVLVAGDYFGDLTMLLRALLRGDLSVAVPGTVAAHVLVTGVFLAYLPFTRMMHFVAKYFTYHEVRWNDEPMTAGGRLEREVRALLSQAPTWSGPHLQADGIKTWVDIATEEGRR
jgi:nitrate reductase gamma subunit